MHNILTMTDHEAIDAIRDMFKELAMIYEKMIWVRCIELKILLSEAILRLMSVLILAECLQDRNCHKEKSTYILLGE